MNDQLSVGDGFKFGCGFFLAGFIAWIIMVIVMFIFTFVFGSLAGGIFEDLIDTMGLLLPLLAVV